MPSRLLLLRPDPGAQATLRLIHAAGMEALWSPLFSVEPVAWQLADPSRYDAVIAGSANGFRHGGAGLAALTHLPVIAVGDATAKAAQSAGFSVMLTGSGGLQAVLDDLPVNAPMRLLRLAGAAHVPLTPPFGVTIDTVISYEARPLPLTEQAKALLSAGGAVAMLHSGEAASHFSAQIEALGLARSSISVACMAPRIAQQAGDGWAEKRVAADLADASVVALAAELCQKTG